MIFSSLVCPVSNEKIDSNVSRTTIFLNVLFMSLFMVAGHPAFMLVVSIDYFIRAFLNMKYSPLRITALSIVNITGATKKPIDLAQKIFASRLGFLCAVFSFMFSLFGMDTASALVAGFLMILSIMDSVLNICVGCLIYNYLVFPFYRSSH